jgi:cellobiose transport system permease protein
VLGAALVVASVLVCWAPIWFMLVVSSRDSSAATTFPPPLLPGGDFLANLTRVVEAIPIAQALANSLVVAAAIALGQALLCTLAGFAFAKLRFRGRSTLFAVVIVALTLPTQLAVIPNYLLISSFGWLDSLQALIIPGLASAFGVFWMRQHITAALSDETLDAAALDGCGVWGTFWRVAFPIVRPGAVILAVIVFAGSWNDFLWPLIVLRSPAVQTVQVAVSALRDQYGIDYALVFAGALLSMVPMIALAVWAGRRSFTSSAA